MTTLVEIVEQTETEMKEEHSLQEELKVLGEERIKEIRQAFLPLVGKKGYLFPLKTTLEWIGMGEINYSKKKEKFKSRFLKKNPYFREAKSDDDPHGKYIEKKVKGTKLEIYLSADGFKQYCAAQKTEKANAVREYFVRIEAERVEALYATPEKQVIQRGEYEELVAQHNKRISEFVKGKNNTNYGDALVANMDKDLSKNIEDLIQRMKKMSEKNKRLEIALSEQAHMLSQTQHTMFDLQRQVEPDGSNESYTASVNAKLREKEFPHLVEVYQIQTSTVNRWLRIGRKRKKNSGKKDSKKDPFDSDSSTDLSDPESIASMATVESQKYAEWGLSKELISQLTPSDMEAQYLSDDDFGDEAFSCDALGYYSLQSFGKFATSLSQKDEEKIRNWKEKEDLGINKKKKKPMQDFILVGTIRVRNRDHYNKILKNIGVERLRRHRTKVYHTTFSNIQRAVDITYLGDIKEVDEVYDPVDSEPDPKVYNKIIRERREKEREARIAERKKLCEEKRRNRGPILVNVPLHSIAVQ